MKRNKLVEAKYGTMLVNIHDQYIGKSFIEYGEFSEHEVDLFRKLITKDMVVLDVGANIGAHTVVFAQMAKEVHSFEPQEHIYHMLCANVALNELDNVRCYSVALGDGSEIPYDDIDLNRDNNMGALSLIDGVVSNKKIPTYAIATKCHFMKIDVEGMELMVLKGSKAVIKECQPILYIENDRADKSHDLIKFINDELDYKAYWHLAPLFNEHNHFGVKENIFEDVVSINMVCFPSYVECTGLVEAKPDIGWKEAHA